MKKNILMFAAAAALCLAVSCQSEQKNQESQPVDALRAIAQRTSVRKYVQGKAVEQEKVDKILRAAMAAPSGMDRRPWEFVVVNDRALLDSLAASLSNAKMLATAPMAIVVAADTTKSEYWYLNCSAAAQNILLSAKALGLGTVWTAAYPYQDRMGIVKKYLQLPEQISPLCVIPVGYPDGSFTPKDKWDETRVHYNKWK